MTEEDLRRLNATAENTALLLLLRHVIGMVYFHRDRDEFRRRLTALEETVAAEISGISFANSPDATAYARETATTIVTNILTAIVHPEDSGRHRDA